MTEKNTHCICNPAVTGDHEEVCKASRKFFQGINIEGIKEMKQEEKGDKIRREITF